MASNKEIIDNARKKALNKNVKRVTDSMSKRRVKRKKKARKKVVRVKAKSGPGPFGANEVEGQFNLDPDIAISADATSKIDSKVAPAKRTGPIGTEKIIEGSGTRLAPIPKKKVRRKKRK